MDYRKIPLEQKQAWAEALAKIPHSFFHTWECVHAMAEFHQRPAGLHVARFEDAWLLVPALERSFNGRTDLVSPYGYAGILSANITSSQLDQFSRRLADDGIVCSYLTLSPVLGQPSLFSNERFFRTNSSFVVDLRLSEEELLRNIYRKSRAQVQLRAGAQLVHDADRLIEPFLELYETAMQRVEASESHWFDEPTLRRLCKAEKSRLLGVEVGGRIIAVTLCAWTAWVADYLLNVATEEGRKHSTPLVWNSMLFAKHESIPLFNLGGGMRDDDTLSRYKSRFGGRACDYGALKLVHDTDTYGLLCKETGSDDADLQGFFPAYRRKA